MADPSRATVQSEWAAAIKVLERTRQFGNVNATNLLALINSLETIYAGDFVNEASSAIQSVRGLIAGAVSQGTAQSVMLPFLKTYLKSVIGRTGLSSAAEMWAELRKYFIDTNLRVDSRRMTFGSSSAGGSNVGNPQVLRLTRDRYNFDIESGYGDSKRLICIADQNTGTAQGNETWQIVGQARAKDDLQRSGSGLEATINGLTLDDSLLSNPGFRTFGGTAGSDAPTSLTGWTSTDLTGAALTYNVTNYGIDQTNTFRTGPSDGTPGSLTMKVSSRITQKLTVRGTELDKDTPYLLAVVWNRSVGAATGTLNMRMGAITSTVTLAAQSGYQVTTVPSPVGFSAWYRQFAQNDMQVQIEFVRTGGTLNICEVLLVPGTQFDGVWYWILPSSATWTAPRVLDTFTFADGESSTGGVNQRWFARAQFAGSDSYLPHSNGSSITFADA